MNGGLRLHGQSGVLGINFILKRFRCSQGQLWTMQLDYWRTTKDSQHPTTPLNSYKGYTTLASYWPVFLSLKCSGWDCFLFVPLPGVWSHVIGLGFVLCCHKSQSFWGCLVRISKQQFLVFKQYFTYFYTLFHPHIFSQKFLNNNFNF